jgi:hypothetical protein
MQTSKKTTEELAKKTKTTQYASAMRCHGSVVNPSPPKIGWISLILMTPNRA